MVVQWAPSPPMPKNTLTPFLTVAALVFNSFVQKWGGGGQKHLEVEGRAGHGKDMPEVGEQGGG